MTDNADVASVTSSVIFVTELDRSVRFYTEVFGCTTSLRRDAGALLLTPGGFQLYLIAKGDRAVHETGDVGAQYPMWATDTAEALTRFAEKLKSLVCYSYTQNNRLYN